MKERDKIKEKEFLTKFSCASFTLLSQIVLSHVANHVSLNGGYQLPDCSAHPFGIITVPSVIWRLWTYGVLFNPENSSTGFISISHTAIHSSILRVAEHKYDKFQPLRTNLRKPPLTEPQSLGWPILVIMLNQPHYNTGCFLPHSFTLHAEDYGICFCFQHQWETASLIFFSLIFFLCVIMSNLWSRKKTKKIISWVYPVVSIEI